MKQRLMIATAACLSFAASAASADCAAEIAALGIAKDGSTAPLAVPATPQTGGDAAPAATPTSEAGGIAKDGSKAPLGTDPALATSPEDAQAQSQGGKTAAEQAAGAAGGGTGQADALARARAALDAGDEAACLQAVEEAKAM
jgi:hypothetical protein